MNPDTMTINGEEYVRKASIPEVPSTAFAVNTEGLRYCTVRTYSAGVFAGYLKELDGQEATVLKARRLWYWKGAASLSELSQHGVTCPKECKFPCEVPEVILTNVVEVIPCTEKAQKSIQEVPEWKMRK